VSLAAFIQTVAAILEKADVPYMLTGSLAAAYYATPRATQDVDLVIDASEEGIERLVDGLHDSGFYVDRAAALNAWRTRSQFNAIDPDSGWKVDLIVRKDRAFSEVEFERRARAEVLGLEVSLASLEDVLLAKLEWAKMGDSEFQRTDVVRLLERAGGQLDREYVEAWVSELGLKHEWDAVLGRLKDTPPEA
jgi:predicted nucleotidyltransferase